MAKDIKRPHRICIFIGTTILTAIMTDLVSCQNDSLVPDEYEAKHLYTVATSIDPSAIQIIADPRWSSVYFPMFEMVYMSEYPRSEIRRLPKVMDNINTPESWPSQTDIVTDQTTIANPNKVGVLPQGTVDTQPSYVWWVASGFFDTRSAFKSNTGGIFLINLSSNKWMPIPILNKTGKGFTHAEWVDMDIDGKVDCVTIQGSNSMNTLLWLRQPEGQTAWVEQRISGVGDNVGGTEFRLMRLRSKITGSTTNVFIVAGRTTGKLTAYWVEDADNDWTRKKKIKSLVIGLDGSYVGLEIVDLNMDGRMDILTSTSAAVGKSGMVIAYEYPRDGFDGGGKWRKHILSQWPMAVTSYTTTTPGPVFSFTTHSSVTQYKPHILVSGQDDGKVYILSPDSWSTFIWDYTLQEIFNSTTSIGRPAIADVNEDGKIEIFIPSNYGIHVLSYGKLENKLTSMNTTGPALDNLSILQNFAKKLWSQLLKLFVWFGNDGNIIP